MSEFPGMWVSESGRLAYRVLPKCACSTIGQILHYGDGGAWFEGDIHDAETGLLKWDQEANRERIRAAVEGRGAFAFTAVRNPYTRVLSAFFDKICGVQRNGRRYRGNLVPMLAKRYGVEVEGEFDQVASFRRFLLFVRDTVRFKKPMPPDIHWIPMASHLGWSVRKGCRLDAIFATERFDEGMAAVLAERPPAHPLALSAVPRFNESEGRGARRAHPVAAYFDDLSTFIMQDVYRRDFQLFRYDPAPGDGPPRKPIDAEAVTEKLLRKEG